MTTPIELLERVSHKRSGFFVDRTLKTRSGYRYTPVRLALDVVALVHGRPHDRLVRGQVGTVVEVLSLAMFEVEFSDDEEKTYAMLPLAGDELIVLHTAPVRTS